MKGSEKFWSALVISFWLWWTHNSIFVEHTFVLNNPDKPCAWFVVWVISTVITLVAFIINDLVVKSIDGDSFIIECILDPINKWLDKILE